LPLPAALAAALATLLVASAAPAALAPPLSHAGRWLTDAQGRVVVLHGLNLVAKTAPFTPQAYVGLDDAEAVFLASEGFDSVRLGVIDAAVEPRPGVYDAAYIARIAAAVRLLGAHGLYTLIDFHQDDYGAVFGGDGFPSWATLTAGLPNPQLGFAGDYTGNPALQNAFQSLYADRPAPDGRGLARHFASALARVAAAVGGNSHLVGYDILNEPWPGAAWASCAGAAGCPALERAELLPLYRRAIASIRRVDPTHLVFTEPFLLFDFGAGSSLASPARADREAGFAFHDYCLGSLQRDGSQQAASSPALVAGCAAQEQRVLANALGRSRATGDALLASEWGATDDPLALARMAGELDSAMLSWEEWTLWNGSPSQSVLLNPTGRPVAANADQAKLAVLGRPYPRAVAGTPLGWHWDPATHVFTLDYTTRPVGRRLAAGALTEVFAGRRDFPGGYIARVSGAQVVSAAAAPVLLLAADRRAAVVHVMLAPGGIGGAYSVSGGPRVPARLVTMPADARCRRRRSLLIGLHPGRGVHLRSVVVTVDGRRVRLGRHRRRLAPVRLRRLPAFAYVVAVRVEVTAHGQPRAYTVVRHYRACATAARR
jgi:endoglycosylceramidase